MDTSYEHYAYFGWDYNSSLLLADGTSQALTTGPNFRHDGVNTNYNVVINNFYVSSGSSADLYVEEVQNGKTATYTFMVEGGYCKNVEVKAGGASAVFTSSGNGVKAKEAGNFGFFVRCNNKEAASGVLIKNISVVKGTYTPDASGANREMPAEIEKPYNDSKNTRYKAGYVLHYMDFSKVNSFEDTGYFFTNDASPVEYSVTDGKLRVATAAKAFMLFTANGIPKNIQNYTVEIKFSFADNGSSYFAFLQSMQLKTDFTNEKNFNTCVRYSGVVDNAEAIDEEVWAKVVEKYQAGEIVTFTYTAMERYCYQLKIACGDDESILVKGQNTLASDDTYMGILFGYGSTIDIYSVKITAGSLNEIAASGYIWPAEEYALVQSVSADAIDTSAPVSTTTTAATTASLAGTSANGVTTTLTTKENGKKGCKSNAFGTVLIIVSSFTAIIALSGKKVLNSL